MLARAGCMEPVGPGPADPAKSVGGWSPWCASGRRESSILCNKSSAGVGEKELADVVWSGSTVV